MPSGWFVVATSAEVARRSVVTRRFMGEDLVVYRTAAGEVRAVDPYCPHLGAHLGHAGAVVGESLRCGFHGFQFDGAGACVATAYGGKAPRAAKLGVRRAQERDGLVVVWHDPSGAPPSWEVPVASDVGWTPLAVKKLSAAGHPQETSENSVDLGHFSAVHGYRDVALLGPAVENGPHLSIKYGMTRPAWPLGALGVALRSTFAIDLYGLGYSRVLTHVPALGVDVRHLVCATPSEPGRVELYLGVSLRAGGRVHAAGARALSRVVLGMFQRDVMQDFAVWEHKRYLARPALAEGDGPIGMYRRWAGQFYPPA